MMKTYLDKQNAEILQNVSRMHAVSTLYLSYHYIVFLINKFDLSLNEMLKHSKRY